MNEKLRKYSFPIADASVGRALARVTAIDAMRARIRTELNLKSAPKVGSIPFSPGMAAFLFLPDSPIVREWNQTGAISKPEIVSSVPLEVVLYLLSGAESHPFRPLRDVLKADLLVETDTPPAPQELILSLAGFLEQDQVILWVDYQESDLVARSVFPKMLIPKETVVSPDHGCFVERTSSHSFTTAFAALFRYLTIGSPVDLNIDPKETTNERAARFFTRPESFFNNNVNILNSLLGLARAIDSYPFRGFEYYDLEALNRYFKKHHKNGLGNLGLAVKKAFERAFDLNSERQDEDYYHSFSRDNKNRLRRQCGEVAVGLLGDYPTTH